MSRDVRDKRSDNNEYYNNIEDMNEKRGCVGGDIERVFCQVIAMLIEIVVVMGIAGWNTI